MPGVRHSWLVLGWLLVFLVIFLSLTPAPLRTDMDHADKLSHVLAYAVLMLWFAQPYETARQRILLAIGFVGMGVALEFLQRWTGYRSFEVADMAASTAGVAAGWMFAPPRLPNGLRATEKIFQCH